MKKSLVLTGMMGVGKSTIGSSLSVRLNMKFKDMDKLIERSQGKSIKKIFSDEGEKYFRKIEKDMTLKILDKKDSIISLGGGAFIDNEIRKKVKINCISFWLDSSISSLMKRSSGSNKRPLLDMDNLEISLTNIYNSRKKIYQQANYRIDCTKFDKKTIIDNISKAYENH